MPTPDSSPMYLFVFLPAMRIKRTTLKIAVIENSEVIGVRSVALSDNALPRQLFKRA